MGKTVASALRYCSPPIDSHQPTEERGGRLLVSDPGWKQGGVPAQGVGLGPCRFVGGMDEGASVFIDWVQW